MSLKQFFDGYVTTALWSSNDESDESGGDPLDANYSSDDIAPDTLAAMHRDCKAFYEQFANVIESDKAPPAVDLDGQAGRAGHDFWLTRNGHGAGFWDGDWPEPEATILTDASKQFGSFDLYIGDDGNVHGM